MNYFQDVDNEKIETYIEQHSDKEDSLLSELVRETHLKMIHPRMLSGVLQGQILESFVRMLKPNLILELGTFTGYSALCMARGLENNGKIITVDIDEEVVVLAKKYFEKSDYSSKIDLRVGDALKIIEKINEPIDLVFIDADKSQYKAYYELLLPKMKSGTFIIADNVLWSGKVVQENLKNNDYFTQGIIEFNALVQNDKRVSNYILPVRDGMMVIRKN
ncbi:MAG: O-methyltransferase [Bacteroidales bacterium]|nr:O-methyltransferase [Bacteroidales bacterium]